MAYVTWKDDRYITTWDQFDENIRFKGVPLLERLGDFPELYFESQVVKDLVLPCSLA